MCDNAVFICGVSVMICALDSVSVVVSKMGWGGGGGVVYGLG